MDRPDTAPSLSTLPTARSQSEPPPRPAGSRWRRRALLLAVVVFPALFVRGCVLDTFAIRSNSMAPIFQGSSDAGDHLLVLRTGLDPRPLQRWDVVVVDGSVDPTLTEGYGALLKRVAALPGERVELRSGDLWVSPGPGQPMALERKPDELIRALLVPVHTGAGLATPWIWEGPGTREPLTSGGVRLTAGDEPGHARFAESVADGQAGVPGEHSVSDTALRLVVGACDATLELQLREGADVFRASLAPAARGGAALQHNLGGRVVASAPDFPGLKAGDTVLAWNVDDGVRVFVNDRLLLSWDQPPHDPPPPGGAPRNDPGLVVTGGSVELREVVVLHDLHYTAEGAWAAGGEFGVPPGQVFLLGDNSLRSRDSRYFGPVPEGAVLGRPFARYAPFDRAGWLDREGAP
ncbi:MAG TPA: S26 family signal peptidase [Planctomycetota bacterium]|nr:S26 family signal peptidase [Planctomycetota bacterium]